VPPPQSSQKVSVSGKSLEDVLAALQDVAAALADNTARLGGSGSTPTPPVREPTVNQSRAILDYLVVSELLAKVGVAGRVVSADRNVNNDGKTVIRFSGIPTEIDGRPVTITHALVSPGGGGTAERALLVDDDGSTDVRARGGTRGSGGDDDIKRVTLEQIPPGTPIIRIELQTTQGEPLALGPRLPGSSIGLGGATRARAR
jgi:hypothetical protein